MVALVGDQISTEKIGDPAPKVHHTNLFAHPDV